MPYSISSMPSTRSRCTPTAFITAISRRRSSVESATELAITMPPTTSDSAATRIGKEVNWSIRPVIRSLSSLVSITNTPGMVFSSWRSARMRFSLTSRMMLSESGSNPASVNASSGA